MTISILSFIVLALAVTNFVDWQMCGRHGGLFGRALVDSRARFLFVLYLLLLPLSILFLLHIISYRVFDCILLGVVGISQSCIILWRHQSKQQIQKKSGDIK